MNSGLVILLRSIFLFFFTLVLTKIIGNRNISKLPPFNFISYVVIAVMVSLISLNIITNFLVGFVAILAWILLLIALDYACMKSKRVHDAINGKNRMVIKNGKVMEENLSKVKFTGDELLRELRCKNVFNLADVEFAIMETSGDINIGLKSDKNPITAHDLGIKVSPKIESETVILDGNIVNEGLTNMGLSQRWLNTQLEITGVSIENVFIGQVNSSGDLYLDLFDDNIEIPQPKVKELLYANLQKSQADLISFALETENAEAKSMYLHNAQQLKEAMKKLKPYLLN